MTAGEEAIFPCGVVVAPDDCAGAHVERADSAACVRDVGDAVGDDGGELDQRAEAARPNDSERRPNLHGGMCLRPARVGAVRRPLQIALVDPHRRLRMRAERQAGSHASRSPAWPRPSRTHARWASGTRATPSASVWADRWPTLTRTPWTGGPVSPSTTVTCDVDEPCGAQPTAAGRAARGVAASRQPTRSAAAARIGASRSRLFRAPPPPAAARTSRPTSSRITCEKKRVITTPSRKSPSRGSGRSPFASASASSG